MRKKRNKDRNPQTSMGNPPSKKIKKSDGTPATAPTRWEPDMAGKMSEKEIDEEKEKDNVKRRKVLEKPIAKRRRLLDSDIRTYIVKQNTPHDSEQHQGGAPHDQDHGLDSTTSTPRNQDHAESRDTKTNGDQGECSQEPAQGTQEPGTRNLHTGPGTKLEAEGIPGHQYQAEQSTRAQQTPNQDQGTRSQDPGTRAGTESRNHDQGATQDAPGTRTKEPGAGLGTTIITTTLQTQK